MPTREARRTWERLKTVEALDNVLITNLVLNTAQAHFNEDLAQSLEQKHRITFGGVTASIVIGLAMQDTGENAVEEWQEIVRCPVGERMVA